jgi:hypothetical protein
VKKHSDVAKKSLQNMLSGLYSDFDFKLVLKAEGEIRIVVIFHPNLGPTPDFVPLNSANSGLPVPRSCAPELVGL